IDMRFLKSLNFGTYVTMSEQEKTEHLSPEPALEQETPADVIGSDSILKGKQEVLIQHGETTYRLRITQNGKLILCK
ncbi:MAG: hemin uptake protein HemP, partial [Planctomycetaceae bacterium]|nr:hemin uptake protein HemP [Planctomycetaceae bacterium]